MIDLTSVISVLDECDGIVSKVHKMDIEDSRDLNEPALGSAGERRREVAECSRELIRLADNLALASALVRNEYHVLKGAPDPVFSRETDAQSQA